MSREGAVRSIQAADVTMPAGRARGDVDAAAPGAARPHVLEVPLARDAGADPGRVHRHRPRRRVPPPPVRPAALRRSRVRDDPGPRRRALDDQGGDPRRAPGPDVGRLPGDRRAARRLRPAGPGPRARRGRDRELLSVAGDLGGALVLLDHAVAHPRARHPRVPALAGAARPRGVGGRALRRRRRRTRRRARESRPSTSATRRGWPGRASRPAWRPRAPSSICASAGAASRSGTRRARAACRGRGGRRCAGPSPTGCASPATPCSRRGPGSGRPRACRRP